MQKISFIRRTALVQGLGCAVLFFTACGKPQDETDPAAEASAAETAEMVEAETEAEAEGTPDSAAAEEVSSGIPGFETFQQQSSYGIGYKVGASIAAHDGLEIDFPALVAGIEDGLKGARLRLDEETIQAAFQEIENREQARVDAVNDANLVVATAFLAENAKRPGVTVTPSGLQYEVISASADPEALKPTHEDTVEVHYHGTLINGTVFDSSIQRGEPITLAVTGVIPGWTEALQMMSVGDKWKLYLPPSLAYGARNTGSIAANSALIFEVELISIVGTDAEVVP